MRSLVITVLAMMLTAVPGCSTRDARTPRDEQQPGLKQQLERADLAMREARLTDAEALYRELAAAHPRLPEIWLQLGNIYARQSQVEAAVHSYKQGLGFTPADGRLWHNLALMELRQSIRTLETASELLPPASPERVRIQELHRALLRAGQSTVGTD